MKKQFLIISVLTILIYTANAQEKPAEKLAKKMANAMKDSLDLTGKQRNAIYDINMLLHEQKMAIRKKYPHPDSVRKYIQRIENTRDSLYITVIGQQKKEHYKKKKKNVFNEATKNNQP